MPANRAADGETAAAPCGSAAAIGAAAKTPTRQAAIVSPTTIQGFSLPSPNCRATGPLTSPKTIAVPSASQGQKNAAANWTPAISANIPK